MRVIGIRVIHVPDKPDEYIIYGLLSDRSKIEIYLSDKYKVCRPSDTFIGYTLIPIERPNNRIIIPDIAIGQTSYESELFSFDEESFSINLIRFEKTIRYKEKRPVWLFTGPSNMGKSFIAYHCKLKSYETDISDRLPDSIDADIVVIGKRYKYTVEDIKARCIGNNEYILVEFSLSE